jgi:hypothetical protein
MIWSLPCLDLRQDPNTCEPLGLRIPLPFPGRNYPKLLTKAALRGYHDDWTWVPGPIVAMMPVGVIPVSAVIPIVVTIVAPVRLSALAKRQ